MVPAITGPTPKTCVRLVPEALTAAASFFVVSRSWTSRWRRPARNSAASSARAHSVPDVEAHGTARRCEPTYSVRFDAADLWGDGQRGVSVHVDLWDSYLERS